VLRIPKKIKIKRGQTCLFGELDKVLLAIVCASTRLQKGTNGEEGQKDFEDSTTGVILVGRLDIAGNYMGARYFKGSELCLDECVGEKGKEGLKHGG
jgi:hypothetical protein